MKLPAIRLRDVDVGDASRRRPADDETAKPDDKPPAAEREGRPDREEMRERMLEHFDADGDGEFSDEEREKAREFRREHCGDHRRRGRGRRAWTRRPRGRGPASAVRTAAEGRRSRKVAAPDGPWSRRPGTWPARPEGPGPGGPRWDRPADRCELFKEFDADKNEQLSRRGVREADGPSPRAGRPGPPRGTTRSRRPPAVRGRGGPDGRPPRADGEGRPRRVARRRRREVRRRSRQRDDDAEGRRRAEGEKAESRRRQRCGRKPRRSTPPPV